MPIFLAPYYLLLGLAAGIPVALHLLHRRRPKPIPFSTLRFLLDATAKTRRSRHLTNFLILLMRILIILLLACSFARPKVRARWLPTRAQRTVVLVLDGSASMHFRDGDETNFGRAKAWALNLIRSLDEGDQVALVVPGLPEPRLVLPAISDHDLVERALTGLEPGYAAVDLVEALNDVLGRLPEGATGKGLEIHLFSDFQAAGWDVGEAEALDARLGDREILLFLNHVRPGVVANAGILKAVFYPPAILGDGEFQVSAQIKSSADFDGSNVLRLFVDQQEQKSRSFRLLPDQTLEEGLAGTASGEMAFVRGRLELSADGFAPDNIHRFCLPRLPGIPVLLVDGSARDAEGTRDTFFLRHAIQPRGKARTLFLPRVVDWQTFLAQAPGNFRVIYVCNPPALDGTAVARLEDSVRTGATVVLMPGQHGGLDGRLADLAPLRGLGVRKEVLPQERAMAIVPSLRPSELEKKLLALMPPPSALVIRRRLLFTALPGNALPIFHYPDGGVFMFEVAFGQGSLWVTSVSANRDWSEWPLTPFFVVLQQELIKSAARRSLTSLTTAVGGVLALDWPADATELDVRLRAPSGRERTLSLSRSDSSKPLVFSGFDEPGFYELEHADTRRVVAVNVPGSESDLTYLGAAELAQPLRATTVYQAETWHEQQQNLVNLHHGRPLWPLLLVLAFVIAIAEEFVANIRSRTAVFPEALRQFLMRGGRTA